MQKRWFFICLLVSLLLHVSTYVSLNFVRRDVAPSKEIEVTIIDNTRTKDEVAPLPKQLVDQDEKSVNDETPKDAKYLSRNNQRVEKETKAQAHGAFANRDNGAPSPQQQARQQMAKTEQQEKPQKREKGEGHMPSLKDLTPKYSWSHETAAATEGQGPSTNDDYLKDPKDGPETLLNTREFVYFSYYSRIKEKLRQHWEPRIKQKIVRLLSEGRKIASQDRITKIVITLNREGILVRVQVLGESGVKDLDDAAIEAFQAAAPFPNPPAGIVESDGTIKIRWDFVLEANNVKPIQKAYAQRLDEARSF